VTVVTNANLDVSGSGTVSTASGYWKVGTYPTSGTDSDPSGDAGTRAYTLHVTPMIIKPAALLPSSVSRRLASGFSTLLAPTSENGTSVVYLVASSNANLNVSSTGKAIVLGGPLKVGTNSASGTDSDSLGDTGTWSYTLAVTVGTIIQAPPFSETTTVGGCSGFYSRLEVMGATLNTALTVTSPNAHRKVSASGRITTAGSLGVGTCTVSGSDSDSLGETGTWTFTLTVTGQTAGKTTLRLYPRGTRYRRRVLKSPTWPISRRPRAKVRSGTPPSGTAGTNGFTSTASDSWGSASQSFRFNSSG
jgi:hypothetical protein